LVREHTPRGTRLIELDGARALDRFYAERGVERSRAPR
jgi:hypothetical protein